MNATRWALIGALFVLHARPDWAEWIIGWALTGVAVFRIWGPW